MSTRREMLQQGAALAGLMAGLGLLPGAAQAAWNAAAFDADSPGELARVLGLAAPVESREVTVQGPEVAENGTAVSVGCTSTAPGVRRLMLLVEKNPNPVCAIYEVGELVEPSITLRVKMAESSLVYAVAVTGDGRVLFARKDIKVTAGGCGG